MNSYIVSIFAETNDMLLNKLDKIFLEDPKRMDMGKGKLSIRYGFTEQDIVESRERVRKILSAAKVVEKPVRKLFFDLEVSANICFSWRIGRDVALSPDDIIQERAIICACWKWDDEDTVHSLKWNKGDDKALLEKFSKIIDSADEVVTQNGDAFDIKWLRARCIYHGIPVSIKLNSIDTLKMARAGFKFNSNKLDYMGKFMGIGEKIKTEYGLWKNITLHNCKHSMVKMVDYCKQDVILLEKVYNKLKPFVPQRKFKYK